MWRRVITGWKLDLDDRKRLLAQFPPMFPDVVADHVTLDARANESTPLPRTSHAEVVGEIDDGAGVQALVVRIDGTTDRPDGSTYHLTWSLDKARGRRAVESNSVISELGWRPVEADIPVRLIPSRL